MKKKIMVGATVLSAISPIAVFAQEASGTANSAVVSAMTTTANDMLATGNSIVPVALTVVGLSLVVTFGVRLFRRVAK